MKYFGFKYYGFTSANGADEPAWFHTPAAAERFAKACGWENPVIEECDSASADDILDTPSRPWYAETTAVELVNEFHNRQTTIRVHGRVEHGEMVAISRNQYNRAWKVLCGMKDCRCGVTRGGGARLLSDSASGKFFVEKI